MKNKEKYDLEKIKVFTADGRDGIALGVSEKLDEKTILRNIDKKYKWIARNTNESLMLFEEKPFSFEKQCYGCEYLYIYEFNHLFKFIKWDCESYNIEELLKDE